MRTEAIDRTQRSTQDAEDSARLYLNEISRIPLLAPARELELAEQIALGDEAAVGILVESNLRLVVRVARAYRNEELPFLDLVQEGNLGLLRAARKFDHRLGYRFSTYAMWWIRQAMVRAIRDYGQTIRVPVRAAECVARLRRAESDGEHQNSQTAAPMPDRRWSQPSAKIIEMARRVQQPLSLDRVVDDMVWAEVLADDTAVAPPQAAEIRQLREHLHDLLEQLPDRLRTIIELRFGLRDGHYRSLQEVSEELGVSRERIRSLEMRALAMLRRAGIRTNLHAYLK